MEQANVGNGNLDNQLFTSQKQAQEIMGLNFFGIKEATRYFGINPKIKKLSTLSKIPFTEKKLESCHNTHILVAGFGMSLFELERRIKNKPFHLFCNEEVLTKDRDQVGWYLIRKKPIPGSTSKTWNEQKKLLEKDEKVPSTQMMVYSIIGHSFNTGEHLFQETYIRVSANDVVSNGLHPLIGFFGSDGLVVYHCEDNKKSKTVGLASYC